LACATLTIKVFWAITRIKCAHFLSPTVNKVPNRPENRPQSSPFFNYFGYNSCVFSYKQQKNAVWNEAYHFFLIKNRNPCFWLIIKHNMVFTIVIKAFQNYHKCLKISYL